MRDLNLRYLKIAGITVAVLICAVLLLWGGLYWRLQQGPMTLSFIDSQIRQAVASKVPGYNVSMGDAFLEIDPASGRPRIAVKDIVVADQGGNQIASAPQAGVSLDSWALMFGHAKAKGVELIGPSISVRRNTDGSLVLGFNKATGGDQPPPVPDANATPADGEKPVHTSAEMLVNVLNGEDPSSPLSSLEEIKITDAKFRFYDDGNAATWNAPRIAFDYKKTSDGFVVLADGDIASNDKPWHTEISATYHQQTKQFEISSTVDNVIPASAARKIFALTQFAAVTTPLSGHVDMVVDEAGKILSGSGELQAAKGLVNLPDYFAEPIQIDEGAFNVVFDPATESLNLKTSAVNIGGRRFELSGGVGAIRDEAGKLASLNINLVSQTGPQVGSTDNPKPASVIDRVEFQGKAAINKAWLEIDDLVVLSGNSGLRLRGNVAGGEKSPALHMAGRLRDVNLDILRSLWPPIVAPKSRAWVFENVQAGEIPEGTFQINFDENQLAQAREDHRNPQGSIDFQFSMSKVDTHYFKSLPNLQNGSGKAHLQDNSFALDMDGGDTTIGTDVIQLASGRFEAADIQAQVVTGKFNFELDAPVSAMVAVATNPDLKIVNQDNPLAIPKATGSGHVKLSLQFPMVKDPPPDQVLISTQVSTTDVTVDGLAPGIELTNGAFNINLTQDKVDIAGPAKINGLPAKLSWSRGRQGGTPVIKASLTMDEKSRVKLGMKLDDYLLGPVDADVTITKDAKGITFYDVKADLSKATLKLATLSFTRPPTPGTTVSFKMSSDDNGRNIDDFKLDGDGLHLRGAVDLYKDGKLKAVTMPEIRLSDDSIFSVRAIPNDGVTDLVVSGNSLDARPFIKQMLSPPPPKQGDPTDPNNGAQDFTLRAHFDQVTANRGEALTNVTAQLRARGGKIAEANISGTYQNGQQLTATIVPLPDGRQMQVKSGDAGATMRAANLYSKVAGGTLTFSALLGNEEGSPMKNGNLTIRNFEVRNEATLAEVDKRGKPAKAGPRSDSVVFDTLSLPLSADDKFIRIKDSTVRGPSMCATADGVIRKADNVIDISGTIVPACGLSRAFNNVPVLGDILSGGNYNEGIFGLTYAMGGTFAQPKVQINPISFLAPGIFRRLFDYNQKMPN